MENNKEQLPERIKSRIAKLQALAERGYKGEALAARRALDAILSQYGLTIEDLIGEKPEWVWVKIGRDKAFRKLMFQCWFKVMDKKQAPYKEHVDIKNEIAFELTHTQHIDLMALYDFHARQFKKERDKVMENLLSAYIRKHTLWHTTEDEEPETVEDFKPIDWEQVRAIHALGECLENVSFHKQLTDTL